MASTSLYSEALEKFQQAVLDKHGDSNTQRLLNEFLLDGRSNFSTPDAARAAASDLATDAGQKYGAVKLGKVEVVPKKWVDQVLGNIENIVAVGGFMTKNAPESVGMAWFAISLTLNAISNNYSLYALFGKGLTDITEVMIIVVHYDRLYDERQTKGFKASNLVDKLFGDTVSAYAAVLDFAFSVKKHMSGGALDKAKHAFRDFFNAQVPKFQGKLSNIAGLKAKVLESSQGAFQDKTMQHFGKVQAAMDQLQQNQFQARQLQLEQRQMLAGILDDFKDFKESVKRKTPLDYLKDEFMAIKKELAPLPEPYPLINTLLAAKHDNTCTWILQNDTYQAWSKFDRNAVLCLFGGSQSGKSTIIASIVQQLNAEEISRALFVNYVSCLGRDTSQTTTLEGPKLSRICNTLLCQIYDLAMEDDPKISLLETCNQILSNPKSRNAGGLSGRGTQADQNPDFVDAMSKLVIALQRDTVLIIDGVEDLSPEDQFELCKNLEDLINKASGLQKISVLIGSRSDSAFIQRSQETAIYIDVNNNNHADMETVLSSRLRELSGWSDTEKQQAKECVLSKAGSRFSYIDDVAIPFLKQPFQRPIATYLSKLPEGMNESFERAIQSMPPNYFELLRLAVTWSLLAPRKVTVKEVIEAYSGVYTVDETNSTMMIGLDDDAYDPKASALEVEQIKAASGPFLSTEIAKNGQAMVNLQNARQVKAFCEHTVESQPIPREESVSFCDNCKSAMATPSRLAVNPRVAHYEIALVLLKHLNSPLFQKRFGLLGNPTIDSSSNDCSDAGGIDATELSDAQEVAGKDQPVPTSDKVKGQDDPEQVSMDSNTNGNSNVHPPNGDSVENHGSTVSEMADAGEEDAAEEEGGAEEEDGAEEENDAEEEDGVEEEDDDSDGYTQSSIDEDVQELKDVPQDFEYETPWFFDRAPEVRCEINNWPYHLQAAEKLWPLEERKGNETWIRLNRDVQNELNKFASNRVVFYAWQRIWGPERLESLGEDSRRSPLFLASTLGLGTWAEVLLDNGAEINEISGGMNIIQASGQLANVHQNVNLLRLLLEKGADPYYTDDECDPAFVSWLWETTDVSVVKTFVDYEVDFNRTPLEDWTALHIFANKGHDLEAFKLIMNPKDPSKKPNINAENDTGKTPLHELLWRRDVPLDLLKAFLAVEGINVNHDDRMSQRPLAVASLWGSLEIVELLLEAKADVHDQDEYGAIALHSAAQGGHLKCIETLLAANSVLDFKDKIGSTPLQRAASYGRKSVVELLIAKGGDINSTDNHNRTPFFSAASCIHGDQETAQFILTELKRRSYTVGEINKATKGGRTPLRQATHRGFADVLQELLEHINESGDANVKATINKGDEKLKRTPLHCAALRGDPRCIDLLVRNGADASLQDIEGNTPLMMVREMLAQRYEDSYEEALLLLIDADQQAAIADAELPSIAAASGSLRVLQKLHSLRADLHRTDSFGWTPLAHAKQLGHKEAEHFLKHETPWGSILPSKWVDQNSCCILDADGLRLSFEKGDHTCVVSNKPLPPDIERFYYEITLERLEAGRIMVIGFCTLGASPHQLPGWPAKKDAPLALSWGYHSDDGDCFHSPPGRFNVGETYGPGDTVGCGVNLEAHKMWFTKNGKKLAHEFEGVKGRLFPVLGLKDPVSVKTNFGQEPFLWKEGKLVNGEGSS